MNVVGNIFQAEFKERLRRFSFIAMMAAALFAAFWFVPRADDSLQVMSIQPDRFIQAGNPSWIPIASAWGLGFFLPLVGFFYLRNLLSQDKQLGLAPLVQSSPISKVYYTVGKWFSGIALLYCITALVVFGSAVMMLLHFPGQWLSIYEFLSPYAYLLVVIPFFLAVAILFDSIKPLRGVLGTAVFIAVFAALYVVLLQSDTTPIWLRFVDLSGSTIIVQTIQNAVFEQSGQPMSSLLFLGGVDPSNYSPTLQLVFHGTQFGREEVIGLAGMLFLSVGLILLAVPMMALTLKLERIKLPQAKTPRKPQMSAIKADQAYSSVPKRSALLGAWLMNLKGELRLLLAGQKPLWFIVTLGGMAACIFAPTQSVQSVILPLLAVWFINVLSAIGSREHQYGFMKMIATCPKGVLRQALATWAAGILLMLLIVLPVMARLFLLGNTLGAITCAAGAGLLPSLALFLGETTKIRRVFEVALIIITYLAFNGVTAFMLFGNPEDPSIALAVTYLLAGLAMGLLAIAKRLHGNYVKP